MGRMYFPGEYPNVTHAKIHKCWIEQNVWENGVAGIRIHVHFEIENGLNVRDQVAAYFYFPDGRKVPDTNGRFCTSDGFVAVSGIYNSIYADSEWKDYPLFIPKHELHVYLPQSLMVCVGIWQGSTMLSSQQAQFYIKY